MKSSLGISFMLLTVVSGMVHDEIRERGTEGSMASILCRYTPGYEYYVKYFCKGFYKDCETLIKNNGKDVWKYEGRFSLADDKEQKILAVTITDLRLEDAGTYGCGIEKTGQDSFTVVHLTVDKAAPKPPKKHQPTRSSTTTHSYTTEGSFTSTVTNRTGSMEEHQGNTTRPSAHTEVPDFAASVGGVCGGALLTLAVITGIIIAFKCRPQKTETASRQPVSAGNPEESHLYEEMPTTDSVQADGSATDPSSNPPCISVYSTITTPTNPENTPEIQGVPLPDYGTPPSMGPCSKIPHCSDEQNYSKECFTNDEALGFLERDSEMYSSVQKVFKNNPIYLTHTAPKSSAESFSEYSTVSLPQC